jgi:hypothetical protein
MGRLTQITKSNYRFGIHFILRVASSTPRRIGQIGSFMSRPSRRYQAVLSNIFKNEGPD